MLAVRLRDACTSSPGLDGSAPRVAAAGAAFDDAVVQCSAAGFGDAAPTEAKATLEAVLHALLDEILSAEAEAEATIASLAGLLDMCIAFVTRDAGPLIESKAPFALLEVAFDALTIDECEQLWSVLEARRDTLTLPIFACSTGKTAKSKLLLLRIANSLLRRCSMTVHTGLSGKILLFLAYVCPLAERSGVNLSGAINMDNETVLEVDASGPSAGGARDGDAVDTALYTSFWKVHQLMAQPKLIATRDGARREFEAALLPVLAAFEGHSLADDGAAASRAAAARAEPTASTASTASAASSVARKYLTKRSLLRLQLDDAQLRRQVLVQVLIVTGFVTRSKGGARAPPTASEKKTNAPLKRLRARALKLLRETPPNGALFVEYVERIMEREELWREWKTPSSASTAKPTRCGDFSRDPIDAPLIMSEPAGGGRPRRRVDGPWEAHRSKLSRLYALSAEEIDALRAAPDSAKVPDFDKFLLEYTDCDDPENEIEATYHVKNVPLFRWRALRTLCASDGLQFCEALADADASQVESNLDFLVRKIAPDAPRAAPPPPPPPPAAAKKALPSKKRKASPQKKAAEEVEEGEEAPPSSKTQKKATSAKAEEKETKAPAKKKAKK